LHLESRTAGDTVARVFRRWTLVVATSWVVAVGAAGCAGRSSAADEAVIARGRAQPFFVALSVANVEASAAWYQRVFGFEQVRSVDLADRGLRIRLLAADQALLELVEMAGARSRKREDEKLAAVRGVFKVGFRVASLDDMLARLKGQGVALRGDVVTEPDGSLRSAQVVDPDGNVIQIFERL